MSEIFKVICAHCQRSYPWQQERAGKRGKCKCGQIITMPMAPPREEPEDDLYELAELASDAQSAKVDAPPIAVPVDVPMAAVAAEVLPYPRAAVGRTSGYASSREYDEEVADDGMIDPIRDRYVPLALLAAAFVISVWWIFDPVTTGKNNVPLPPLVTWVLTLFDIGIPIALSMVVATRFGLGFGALGPTLLKFGSLVFCVVAAQLWLPAMLRAAGAMSASGDAPMFYIMLVEYCSATLFIGIAGMYLFRMDASEMAMLAITYLVVGIIFDLFVVLIVFGVVGALHSRNNPPAAPPPPGPVAVFANAPPIATPGTTGPTFLDVAITQRIHQPAMAALIVEGNQWKQSNHYAPADQAIDGLIDQMYAAGATKVFIDTAAHPHMLAYVEVPSDQSKRDACNLVADTYRHANGIPQPSPFAAMLNRQYIIVLLKK